MQELLNLCAKCIVEFAVLLDEELTIAENLGALRFVGLYILHCGRSAVLDRDVESAVQYLINYQFFDIFYYR